MDIRVSGHQVDTGEALREHVSDRLGSIADKYFARAISATATFGSGPHDNGFSCDIIAHVMQGVVLKASGSGMEAHPAFDEAAGKIEKQLRRYVKRLRGLQEQLGAINDIAHVRATMTALLRETDGKRAHPGERYAAGLGDVVRTPGVIAGGRSLWAQYTIETEDRDGLAAALRAQEIPTAVYYPIPIHRQDVYSGYPVAPGGLPVTEAKAGKVISLPMHPYLTEDDQDQIVAAIRAFVKKNR